MQQPATKTSDLVKDLNNLTSSEIRNEVRMKGLKVRAQKIVSADPAEGYCLLGMISAVLQDIKGMHENHEKSLRLADSSWEYIQYAKSCLKNGLPDEASKIYAQAYNIFTGDLNLLEQCIESHAQIGDLDGADDFISKWNNLSPDRKPSFANWVSHSQRLLTKKNISVERLQLALKITFDLISKHKLLFDGLNVSDSLHDGDPAFFIRVEAPPKTIVDLNFELSEKFVDAGLIPEIINIISIIFMPAREAE